jgi:hypothetical protein
MTEALIEYYDEPDKTPRIKSFGKFTSKYVTDSIAKPEGSEKEVKTPFDRAYSILLFFRRDTKPVLWRILVEQLYLYNAIRCIYSIKKDNDPQGDIKILKKLKKTPPIQRLPDNQLKYFNKDSEVFRDVEKHLKDYQELKDLIENYK